MDRILVEKYHWGQLSPHAKKANAVFEKGLVGLQPIVNLLHKELLEDESDVSQFYYDSFVVGDIMLYSAPIDSSLTRIWGVGFDIAVRNFCIHPTLPLLITTEDRKCGSEDLDLYMYDLRTAETAAAVPQRLAQHVGPSCAITATTVFYTHATNCLAYYKVAAYDLNSRKHRIIYAERDTRFNVYVRNVTEHTIAIDCFNNKLESRSMLLHRDGAIASIYKAGCVSRWLDGETYLTNWKYPYFALVATAAASAAAPLWHSTAETGSIVDAKRCGTGWLVQTIKQAYTQLYWVGGGGRTVPLFTPGFITLQLQSDGQFVYRTPTTPDAVCQFNSETGKIAVLRQRRLPLLLGCEQHMAVSADGTHVPFCTIRSTNVESVKGLIVIGYGAYGISQTFAYPYKWLPLLRRGYAIVLACVRGGWENGTAWYKGGVHRNRGHCRQDFAACIQSAQRHTHTHAATTTLYGRSAGGFLVASTANRFPELASRIYMEAPFLDVVKTMSDSRLPLTRLEYDEFGNPRELASDVRVLTGLSPVDGICKGAAFPRHVIIRSATHDSQVFCHEADVWTARLARCHPDVTIAYHTDECEGHFVKHRKQLRHIAEDLARILT
jgi:protease II